jgi:D-glycero-D-manno-heptose 1,7-bisphosphate phosphatase|tara:strand:- start:1840 stop:2403 length:564 start_codon:yes stop_codon:yes gene_type:complete
MINFKGTSNKALFLDRDGVININHGYVFRREEFDFIDGIFELALKARDAGYIIVIVTNQSGIARNYYSEKNFRELSSWLENQFWQKGIKIQQTLHCPHHPKFSHNCTCRKPKTGMITKAMRRFNINLKQSIMVGDSLSDMRCAQNAKIKTRVYLNPQLSRLKGKLIKPSHKPYFQARDLKSIIKLIT